MNSIFHRIGHWFGSINWKQVGKSACYTSLAVITIVGIVEGANFFAIGGSSWVPVVITVSCDADNGKFTVTPSSKLSAQYPSLRIEGAFKMVHWYDGNGTKHWVDVSHCSYVKIQPRKLAPVE